MRTDKRPESDKVLGGPDKLYVTCFEYYLCFLSRAMLLLSQRFIYIEL